MPITTRCPACNKIVKAPDARAGYTVPCPDCSKPVRLPTSSSSKKRTTPNRTTRLPFIAAAVVIAFLVVGVGVVLLATSGNKPKPDVTEWADVGERTESPKTQDSTPAVQEPSAKQPVAKTPKAEPTPNPSLPTAKPVEPIKPKPKEQPAAKVDDRRWVLEAKLEYRDALEDKERRMKAYARRLGALDQQDYELAKNILEGIKEEGSIEPFPAEMVRRAEVLAPEYIAALKRERLVNSPDYDDLVRKGTVPLYHPTEKRKKLYAEFAAATSDKAEWTVSRPFAALTAKEMDTLMEGIRLLKDGGFGKMSKAQRLLLLKAGALDYFGAQLKK